MLAVIDAGSRAVRLAVAEAHPGRPLRRLETLSAPVALGVDAAGGGRIRTTTTEAVVSILHDFAGVLQGYGLSLGSCRAVATTAIREARNRDVFLDRVAQRTGLRIEVIEAVEEARLLHQLLGRLLAPHYQQGRNLILALGGGGTQIIVQAAGELVLAESQRFGTLSLHGRMPNERSSVATARCFLAKAAHGLGRLTDLSRVRTVVGLNRELLELAEKLTRGRSDEVGLHLDRKQVNRLAALTEDRSADELAARTGLDAVTAEVGRMALEEVMAFWRLAEATSLTLCRATLVDGLLFEAERRHTAPELVAHDLAAQGEEGAWALARRFHADEAHAAQVRSLALHLFDALRGSGGLSEPSRRLLGVAAIVHDIGVFVRSSDHEVHSAYLVRASEIMGLTRADRWAVATMTRHHRGPVSYSDFAVGELTSESERVELLKLTAILRLAEALDADHQQRVGQLRVEVDSESMHVCAETSSGDRESFLELGRAFRLQADLFEEVFGVMPVLTEVLPG